MTRWAALLFLLSCGTALGEAYLVEDGQARAEIIIARAPPRTVRLAARELQAYLAKISGARLPIATAPSGKAPVKVYVGRSRHTDDLAISAENLKDGAYRIISGDDWLVLIGRDTDFTPIEPWARSHSHWASGKVLAEWDALTGARWGNPMSRMYKEYSGRAHDLGKPPSERVDQRDTVHVWSFDERGSFNAVCGFLRRLGVRWYMPGDLGEVVPARSTIPLPEVDETVRPDFAMRRFNVRFRIQPREVSMWFMRLGVRDPYGVQVAHGLATLTDRREMMDAHPEYYALYGGKRDTRLEQKNNQLCLSSAGLFEETVGYVRALFDHYKMDVASVMPPDGFTAMCQCPLCKGKDTPDRGYRGRLSDYVWDFVNRVAKEVARTHPGKKVLCCAYGAYQQPPLAIEKLEPNVRVCIVGGRRPTADRPEEREAIRNLRRAWLEKTANRILIFENYPFTNRGWYLPAYQPHVLGESINAVKGICEGEDIWLSLTHNLHTPGYNHFPVYFTARMYWGGKERDVDALFNEYCRLFYGPAENEMKAFFAYCEANWRDMAKEKPKADRALALFAAAQAKADADAVYGRRLAVVADFLQALKDRSAQLAKARERADVRKMRMWRKADSVRIDGRLDDEFWRTCPRRAEGHLKDLRTGRKPALATSFKVAWGREAVYFAIRCRDRKGDPVNIATKRHDDPALWMGDCVEILLETEQHAYYQIAVNPAGAVCDLDRGAPRDGWYQWSAQAEVATHVGEDGWTVEVRIPVVAESNDPLHQVVGRKPLKSLPWYFNVCRQRVREDGTERSAFSPTGEKTFHVPRKFARLYER
ncbi:MAG: DUF4838 domain-containing protein [Phycisphaerae bacterium]